MKRLKPSIALESPGPPNSASTSLATRNCIYSSPIQHQHLNVTPTARMRGCRVQCGVLDSMLSLRTSSTSSQDISSMSAGVRAPLRQRHLSMRQRQLSSQCEYLKQLMARDAVRRSRRMVSRRQLHDCHSDGNPQRIRCAQTVSSELAVIRCPIPELSIELDTRSRF